MHRIEIRRRLCPFSHQPGVQCLIPGTRYKVQCFPTCLRIEGKEITLETQGSIDNFTVVQDLERGCVTLFSNQYHIHVLPNLQIVHGKNPHTSAYQGPRYDFGINKKQEMYGVRVRQDIREFFPIWHRLGHMLSLPHVCIDLGGTFQLLHRCAQAISAHRPDTIAPAFVQLFKAAFNQMMVPRGEDTDFQGIVPKGTPSSDTDPLYLLIEGARLIRSLFLRSCDQELVILPDLPPELFAGRIVAESCSFGKLSIQWQQKQLRIMEIKASKTLNISLHLPPDIRRFRYQNVQRKQKVILNRGTPLALEQGELYLLDRFEK